MNPKLTVGLLVALIIAAGAVAALQVQSLIRTRAGLTQLPTGMEHHLDTLDVSTPTEEITIEAPPTETIVISAPTETTITLEPIEETPASAPIPQTISEALQNIWERLAAGAQRHQEIAAEITLHLTEMEDAGIAITVVAEEAMEGAEVEIAAAEVALEAAEDAILILREVPPNPGEIWQILQQHLREVIQRLRQAQINLLEALEEIRRIRSEQKGGDDSPDDADPVPVDQVVSTPSSSPTPTPTPTSQSKWPFILW